ncbi:MAG TPA: sulfatase [Anaerolineae bacterium]|nr:sulfatase [Anaerolineae bacterium]
MNLILVTIDCLRADHVGFMGYPRPVMPTLDRLAHASIVLENAQVTGTPTFFSFPAIFASRYPLSFGRDVVGIPPHCPTLASVLTARGYAAAGLNAGNPYLTRQFGYAQGFGAWYDFLTEKEMPELAAPPTDQERPSLRRRLNRGLEQMARPIPWTWQLYRELYFQYSWRVRVRTHNLKAPYQYTPAEKLTARALEWLTTQARAPFFLWLHYMDAHHPRYSPSEVFSSIGAPNLSRKRQFFLNQVWLRGDVSAAYLARYRQEFVNTYDAGIRRVDDQLQNIIHKLEQQGIWDETAIVVLGDHGEEFLEHGSVGHLPPKLYQELLHVPLLIHAPSRHTPRRMATPFGVIDLAPTLLTMLGVEAPASFQGVSRWDSLIKGNLTPAPIISEAIENCRNLQHVQSRLQPRLLAVREGPHKLLANFAEPSIEFFDLRRDAAEQESLAVNAAPRASRELLQTARAHLHMTRCTESSRERFEARVSEIRHELERRAHTNSV